MSKNVGFFTHATLTRIGAVATMFHVKLLWVIVLTLTSIFEGVKWQNHEYHDRCGGGFCDEAKTCE